MNNEFLFMESYQYAMTNGILDDEENVFDPFYLSYDDWKEDQDYRE